ncbi:MAG TPA: DUF72 domain-containing protein [Actinomycetota bacterium]|nr:DUF72 domain-containing protein [Actinomycetota bacterium]
MPGTLYVGTSGYAYKEWKGPFYPEDLAQSKFLTYYAAQLPSVEINYTFRHLPSDAVLETWRTQTPDGFRLTLKASQRITHFKRLVGAEADVEEFLRRAVSLGDRLGVVLFQLPPNFKYQRAVLEPFLASLPPVVRVAMEFRHESWAEPEAVDLMRAHNVAVCGADTAEHPLAAVPVTAPHVYLRLRKEDYAPEELTAWGGRVRETLAGGSDVYCYFKHEGGGIGPAYAGALRTAAGA